MLLNGLSPDISFSEFYPNDIETSTSASHDNLWLCCIVNHPCRCFFHTHYAFTLTLGYGLDGAFLGLISLSLFSQPKLEMHVDPMSNRFTQFTRKHSKRETSPQRRSYKSAQISLAITCTMRWESIIKSLIWKSQNYRSPLALIPCQSKHFVPFACGLPKGEAKVQRLSAIRRITK